MGETTGIIRAVCISEKKGTGKHEVPKAVLKESWGIAGDAHAGSWHRSVFWGCSRSRLSGKGVPQFHLVTLGKILL